MSRALLFPAGCLCFAILLGLPGAIYAPDAGQYRLLSVSGTATDAIVGQYLEASM